MKTMISKQALKFLLVGSLALGIGANPVQVLAAPPHAKEQAKEQSKDPAMAKPVNINKADAQTIADQLVGIGAAKARAIVKYRETHGPFISIDQLQDVSGVGPALIVSNRQRITLE
jgi:competence protein ComEA